MSLSCPNCANLIEVRRDINAEGRNRAWANGSPTIVGVLSNLGRSLVDLHGQHEAQSLLRPSAQRDILDAFGGAGEARRHVKETHRELSELREKETDLIARRDVSAMITDRIPLEEWERVTELIAGPPSFAKIMVVMN